LVDLERASVQRLDDDWRPERPEGHWPPPGSLRLAGFTYNGFGGDHQATAADRLAWARKSHALAGQSRYAAQVYEQLARVHRQAGQDAEAQQVAIARRTDLRRYGHLTAWRKAGNWLFDVTIRHGYKPGRAVSALVFLYLASLGMLWCAQHQDDVVVPARPVAEDTLAPTALSCTPAYPCYYPAGHAFDTVVPIIKTGQSDDWRVNGDAPGGTWYIAGTWIVTGLGWAFATLAVIGFTGVVRKE
jgi:hypothetical protein